MSGRMDENLTSREGFSLEEGYRKIDYIVNKTYLSELEGCDVLPFPDSQPERGVSESACFFPIKKIVFDQEENNLQKLANVYACAAVAGIHLAMVIKASAEKGVELYLGACDEENRVNKAYPKAALLYNCFMGNFPGSRMADGRGILDREDTEALIRDCLPNKYRAVASVSCVPSLRGQQGGEKNASFYQGIEKVIEAMDGRDYTVVILAKALGQPELEGMRRELEQLYLNLSPFAKSTVSVNRGESDSVMKSLAETVSDSVTDSTSNSLSIGKSRSTSEGTNTFDSVNGGMGVSLGGGNSPFSISPNIGYSRGKGKFNSVNDSDNENQSETRSRTDSHTTTATTSDGRTVTVTAGQTLQLNYENKEMADLLAAIDLHLKRLKSGAGLGMFAVSAYFAAPTILDARMGASTYKAEISGDQTYIQQACVNVWNREKTDRILPYLRQLRHPEFLLRGAGGAVTTPASLVSAPELAIYMNLPKKSVNGIPVCDGVSFGRNIVSLDQRKSRAEKLPLGRIFHLGLEERAGAGLDLDSLTMHTFVTGTTGSGKSNTVYGLIQGIRRLRPGVRFLVIEPAKGEYKQVFGTDGEVSVYGVNPYVTPLLRINPFRFRKGVHVLEHLDRLISIFNVCWPMEAAMPAILKQALERAYQQAGWNLRRSVNRYSQELFPSFSDVMEEVEAILDESRYSEENRGNYIGALCTRLEELTTGLNGMIFAAKDLSDRELFEENVVVDLSRIGSAETKALIMGLLVVRLQEYRQTVQDSIHSGLSHVTVLEEAHHLLKRTSMSQSMDSANLAGKSVEMLTNAFAEMRSAGEGFIIADQSPGLMDMSVIRNTNTKIVMRLPAQEDRELTGRAIGLNDPQVMELAKLPTGVAAVYQNDWLNAVLVRIPYYETGEARYEYALTDEEAAFLDGDEESLLDAIMRKDGIELMVDRLKGDRIDGIARLNLPTRVKCQLINYVLHTEETRLSRLGKVAYEFFNMREAVRGAQASSLEEWKEEVLSALTPSIDGYDAWDQETLLLILSSEYARRFREFEPFYVSLVQKLI